jgi:hypothetical protein
MGNFHSLHVTSERDAFSKILHVKIFETMGNVHNKLYLLQHANIQKHFSWIKKKVWLLQTKLSGASQQLNIFLLTAEVQDIILLAQITCTLHNVLCSDMSQPHTIHIIWHIPVAVDIAIYCRST